MTREVRFLSARLITNFFAVLAVAQFVPFGIGFPPQGTREFWVSVLVFAAVLAIVNAYVRPVVSLVLKPLTCLLGVLTFGLSHFLINVLVFWSAGLMVEQIEITSFGAALLGALVVSVVAVFGSLVFGARDAAR